MMILENNKEEKNSEIISTKARKVADVSGAGDTVISTIAVCLAGGADVKDSVIVSNYAAGLAVEEVGIVAIDRDTLIEHISEAEKEQVSII
jgi:bifunctional ADP-heptose synthase (sugar kinase/adenylyltransferase)